MQKAESQKAISNGSPVLIKDRQNYIRYSKNRVFFLKWFGLIFGIPYSCIVVFIFRFILNYKIPEMKKIRQEFQKIIQNKDPLIICANHLTFIDSGIIIWALASNWWYLFNYNYYSWNLPAGDFFGKKFRYRMIAHLIKGIFIYRDGSKEHHDEILNLSKNLVKNGEVLTIFPEGKRSRSGFFDPQKMSYGVGKIIQGVPNCRVLCMYVRSDKQTIFSNYPARNSIFSISMNLISPTTKFMGREGCAEIVEQIAHEIKNQENDYLNQHKIHKEII